MCNFYSKNKCHASNGALCGGGGCAKDGRRASTLLRQQINDDDFCQNREMINLDRRAAALVLENPIDKRTRHGLRGGTRKGHEIGAVIGK